MKGFLLFAAVGLLAGCGPSEIDLQAEAATLRAAAEEYHETSHRGEWMNLPDHESRDVLILPPNGPSINGLEDAREFFQGVSGFEIRYEEPVVEVSLGGDMGYSIANAAVRATAPDGSVVEDRIRDFHVWKKQDGEWKIAIDMWNSVLP